MTPADLPANMASKVTEDEHGCWICTGARTGNGYGSVGIDGRQHSGTWTAEVRAEMARQRRTQRELAAALGVDQSTVSRWMTERSDWPLAAALDTAWWLGVTPSTLLARAERAAS